MDSKTLYLAAAGISIMLISLWTLTFRQTRIWKSSITLWDHALNVAPPGWPQRAATERFLSEARKKISGSENSQGAGGPPAAKSR